MNWQKTWKTKEEETDWLSEFTGLPSEVCSGCNQKINLRQFDAVDHRWRQDVFKFKDVGLKWISSLPVRSRRLFTPLLSDTTECFPCLATLVFFVRCSWGLFEKLFVSLMKLWDFYLLYSPCSSLDKSFHLDPSLKTYWSPAHWHTVVIYAVREICFPTHVGQVWSFHGCLNR